MYDFGMSGQIRKILALHPVGPSKYYQDFQDRLMANARDIKQLFYQIYREHPKADLQFNALLENIVNAFYKRSDLFKGIDEQKIKQEGWYLSEALCGMSFYVDRFCGDLHQLKGKLDYFSEIGINVLHLMPLFESPKNESDGGYAVSNFRQINPALGTIEDLRLLRQIMSQKGQFLMLDIVLNHTSQRHEWAVEAAGGETFYQDFYYMYDDRAVPDRYEAHMPEIFPESAPGNFTYVEDCKKWVMSVFHSYQWDLNYTNPYVFVEMMENIFFYASLGVDILRMDAPAFIWKREGTSCQNLPEVHTLLRLIRLCVETATPGMALLGEAIVAPPEVIRYFGDGEFLARECDMAYNATQMALTWDALATGETRVMRASQSVIMQKPAGATWISYVRGHDDIGLGYSDASIEQAGKNPFSHRSFLRDFYVGAVAGSFSKGALFSFNPKNQDFRISGTLASLCGLESAVLADDAPAVGVSIQRIFLMSAMAIFYNGLPMLYYGDELGYTNDYSYLNDPSRRYDNRWMHRPLMDWQKTDARYKEGTPEHTIFSGIKRLIAIRKSTPAFADRNQIVWTGNHNGHIAGFKRIFIDERRLCLFNFSNQSTFLTWFAVKEMGFRESTVYDHWLQSQHKVGSDNEYLMVPPYGFFVFE